MTGQVVLALHAHLPFVRHVDDPNALEEDWLFDALTDCYLPLLGVLEGWAADGVTATMTVSLSPTLLAMLSDDLLRDRYSLRLTRLLSFLDGERRRFRTDETMRALVDFYAERLSSTYDRFHGRYSRDVVGAFVAMEKAGVARLITTSATHTYLPAFDQAYQRAQLRLGIRAFTERVGHRPEGLWLPECGFTPGLDTLLAAEGMRYFFVESHAVEYADPRPVFGTNAPIACPSGVVAFPRNQESTVMVWNADAGYPGDGRYREFYRDAGHDRAAADLEGLVLDDGKRRNTGIKYHRVTDRTLGLGDKHLYDREAGLAAAATHARHFVAARAHEASTVSALTGQPAVMAAPFDAELFGHWWFEGPEFLDVVGRACAARTDIGLADPMDVIAGTAGLQVAMPAASSWGWGGYSETWINEQNLWMWPHLRAAAARMAGVASAAGRPTALQRRVLNQLARELVLATASDWPFMVTAGTMGPYGERRVRTHLTRFQALLDQFETSAVDQLFLARLEADDNIFGSLDYQDFAAASGIS
ncbi:glycoside hydrolase family 57 protein [Pseudofrankia inefficax]|uniref:glycoside hydrolase family 57 protein n=1 Tax=Pseudofrankia inefficax (strain DSM 45817 / CECT 9037 / DDB 130130 / EuI1c) TaxID=298654 RepID=UPI00059C6595|nr:1,4-alpha-glucan branching protein domain-containing protein [Pseudofrankia inefficax]